MAVDEVLHASARVNTLDNISVVMIAFDPLIRLIDHCRNPANIHSSINQEAQGQQATAMAFAHSDNYQQHAQNRSRNTYNNVKQLTTGTGESMKHKTINHDQSPKLGKSGEMLGQESKETRNSR